MTQKKVNQRKKDRHRERLVNKKKKQRTRMLMAATVAALIVIVGGFGIYYALSGGLHSQTQTQGKPAGHKSNHRTSNSSGKSAGAGNPKAVQFDYKKQPELGNPNAPVKIVEFGDYRCSVCYHFDQEFFPKIKKQFIKTGKVSFYFMNYPILGEGSIRAALASESVFHRDPNVFWKWHQTVYDHQGSEQKKWATTDFLVHLAKKYVPQINSKQLRKDIENGTYINDVKADAEKGKSLGIQGTPTIFINGKQMDWPHTSKYPELKAAINAAYKKAAKKNG